MIVEYNWVMMPDTEKATVRLVNHAVLAFVGVLVLGQSIGTASDSPITLWGFEIPRLPEFFAVASILVYWLISVYLAVASVFKKMQPLAIKAINKFNIWFLALSLLLFTYAYLDAVPALPYDHWWSWVVLFTGCAIFLLLCVRFVQNKSNP